MSAPRSFASAALALLAPAWLTACAWETGGGALGGGGTSASSSSSSSSSSTGNQQVILDAPCPTEIGPTGNVRWAKLTCGWVGDIAVDEAGSDIAALLWEVDELHVDGGALANTLGRNRGIVRLDGDGSYVWARPLVAQVETDFFETLAVGPDGGVAISGGLETPTDFGAGELAADTPYGMTSYLVTYDPVGAPLIYDVFHVEDDQANVNDFGGSGVAIDGGGNVVIGGTAYGGAASFGGPALPPVSSTTKMESVLASFDAAGASRWARRLVGDVRVLRGNDGAVYVLGTSDEAIDLGGGVTVPRQREYVASFDPAGTARWAQPLPYGFFIEGVSVAATTGDLLLAGLPADFARTVDFGDGPRRVEKGIASALYKPDGTLRWVTFFDRFDSGYGGASAFAATPDGGAIYIEMRGQDSLIHRVDATGAQAFIEMEGSTQGLQLVVLPDGDWLLSGAFSSALRVGDVDLHGLRNSGFIARLAPLIP